MFRFSKTNKKRLTIYTKKIIAAADIDEAFKKSLRVIAKTTVRCLTHADGTEEQILRYCVDAMEALVPALRDEIIKITVIGYNKDFAESSLEEVDNEERAIQKMVEEFNLRYPGFCEPFDLSWGEDKKIKFSKNFLSKWANIWLFEKFQEVRNLIKLATQVDLEAANWELKTKPMLKDFLESLIANGANLSKEKLELFIERFHQLAVLNLCNPFKMQR